MNLPGNQLVSAHREQVASYDPEYFDNFGVFAENILSCVKQTGAKVHLPIKSQVLKKKPVQTM